MNNAKLTYSFLFLLLYCFTLQPLYSQETVAKDTIDTNSKIIDWENIKGLIEREIKDQFPRMRFIDVSYRRYTPANVSQQGEGYPKTKSEFHNSQNIEVSLNVPFYIKPKLKLLALARYDYDSWEIKKQRYASDGSPYNGFFRKENSHVYSTGVQGSYLFSMWNKVAMVNFQVLGEGSVKGYERFYGLAYGTIILNQRKDGSTSVGLVAMLDNKTSIPVVPTFIYTKRLDYGWALDVFLPKHVLIRKSILKNSRMTLGANIDSKSLYLESRDKKMYMYKHNEFKIVSFYDHHFNENIIFSIGAELINSFGGKIIPSNKSQNKYIMKASKNMNLNFQASFSYCFPKF